MQPCLTKKSLGNTAYISNNLALSAKETWLALVALVFINLDLLMQS